MATTNTKAARQIGIIALEAKLGEIPQAVIGDLETKEELGYLTPFRAYSFQVSGDRKGGGDYGSTDVFGIDNVLRSHTDGNAPSNLRWTETQFELLKGMACMACLKFAARIAVADAPTAAFNMDAGCSTHDEDRVLTNGRFIKYWNPSLMDRFIAESIIWVTHNNAAIWTSAKA